MKTALCEIEEWTGHPNPREPRWWPGLAAVILFALLVLACICCLSCTLTVSPDGTRAWQADGAAIARAIIVISADK